jgi:hypothetical protein
VDAATVSERLTSLLEDIERELHALERVREPRLAGVLQTLTLLRAELISALAAIAEPD